MGEKGVLKRAEKVGIIPRVSSRGADETQLERMEDPAPTKIGDPLFMNCVQTSSMDPVIVKFPPSECLAHSWCLMNAPGTPEWQLYPKSFQTRMQLSIPCNMLGTQL